MSFVFSPVRRRAGLLLLVPLLAPALVSCASMALGPRTLFIPEARVVQAIAEQFPFNSRLLDVFDLSLQAPLVRLLPQENRIATRFEYGLGGLWLGTRQYVGAITLSYALRFEASDASVRLNGVRVDAFEVPGVPSAYASRAQRLGALIAERLLNDQVIYRFKPEDLRKARSAGLAPGALRVVPGGLQLELVPAAR